MLKLLCCLTSTEAGWPIRDGDRVGKRARVIGSTAETARKRPERPWTAARTMEVLRRCPLAIAQRLVHCAIALSTAVLDRVTKTMSVAPLLTNNLDNSKRKMSNLLSPAPPPYSWSLLGKSEGPAPPPSSKISWSFDLACTSLYQDLMLKQTGFVKIVGLWLSVNPRSVSRAMSSAGIVTWQAFCPLGLSRLLRHSSRISSTVLSELNRKPVWPLMKH